jgi:hypothetical protein
MIVKKTHERRRGHGAEELRIADCGFEKAWSMGHRVKRQRSEVRGQTTESKNKAQLVSTAEYQDFRFQIADRLNWHGVWKFPAPLGIKVCNVIKRGQCRLRSETLQKEGREHNASPLVVARSTTFNLRVL